MKFLLIAALVGLLFYLFFRRFFMSKDAQSIVRYQGKKDFILVDTNRKLIGNAMQSTLWTVGIGFFIFLIVLILGMKIKILWIALPLALYLIGQLFVYTNHVKFTRDQRIYFNPLNQMVLVDFLKGPSLSFHMLTDVLKVTEVKAVQKNRNIIYGYYKLSLKQGQLIVPYLVEQNDSPQNKQFFQLLNKNYPITVERRLFPII